MGRPADVAEIGDRAPLSSVVGRRVRLIRKGREHSGLCPFHIEKTPSFTVSDDKGFFHCFGCGAHGDVIDFIRKVEGVSFREAVRRLSSGIRSTTPRPDRPPAVVKVDIEERQRRTAETLRTWEPAEPPRVFVPAWFRHRRLENFIDNLPNTIREVARLKHRHFPGEDQPAIESWHPAMIALITRGVDDVPLGIHRTWLQPDGVGKASVIEPRKTLGPVRGGCVRLGPISSPLLIGEGLETVAACMISTGLSGWAALSTSLLRVLDLPEEVKDIIICADNDANGAGEAAAQVAARRWKAEGRRVRIAIPPHAGSDFNDLARAMADV